jgi:hypothetical protein
VFDHGAQIVPRLPGQLFLQASIVGDNPVKISRPPGTKYMRNRSSGFLTDSV